MTGVSSVAVATVIGTLQLPCGFAVITGVGIGAIVGVVLGFLVAKLGLDPFIVSFGVLTLFMGLASWFTDDQLIIAGIPADFIAWGNDKLLGIPRLFFVLIVVAIIVWYLISHTPFGRQLESIRFQRGSGSTRRHQRGGAPCG